MREKLIEKGTCREMRFTGGDVVPAVRCAIIANGVTVKDSKVVEIDHFNKWIPVTERLPELHTKVLCCGKKGGRFIAELSTWGKEEHLCWDKRNGQGCPTVTHWMPLPEPPKEVNGND